MSDPAAGPVDRRRDRLELAGLVLLAAAVRTAWTYWPHDLAGDAGEYLQLARSLATTGRYSYDGLIPASYRPPLYPALLAAISLLTGHDVSAMIALQVLLGALTVGLTASIARRAFGRPAGLIAGLGLATAPMTSQFITAIMTETVFVFLLMLATWAWQRGKPVGAGVSLGLATLARASAFPFLLLLGAAGLVSSSVERRRCLHVAVAALLTISPWVVRNIVEVRRVTVADAGWGTNLLYGTVVLHRGANRWAQLFAAFPSNAAAGDGPTVESEQAAARTAVRRIADRPLEWIHARALQYPWLFVDSGDYLPVDANTVSFARAWAERRLDTVALKAGFLSGNVLVLVLGAYGFWSERRRVVELLPLYSWPVFLSLAHAPVYVEPRYGLPLVPFEVIFAAAGAARACRMCAKVYAPASQTN